MGGLSRVPAAADGGDEHRACTRLIDQIRDNFAALGRGRPFIDLDEIERALRGDARAALSSAVSTPAPGPSGAATPLLRDTLTVEEEESARVLLRSLSAPGTPG